MTVDTLNTLTMSRTIQAPKQAVWDAWTKPEHMKKWSCPVPDGVEAIESDFQVGGSFRIVMQVPEGRHTAFGSYREIDAPNRVVYTWDWDEEDHSVGETLVTVTFEDRDGGTEVTIIHAGFPNVEAQQAHEQGWGGCFANFEGLFA